ncbi:unnamed protein product [Sympodiomycopsis kandeliae]
MPPVRIVGRHQHDDEDINEEEGALYRPSRKAGLGSRRHQSNRDWEREEQAWNASTGSVTARNQALLQRTRFVREGQSSRPWSGKPQQQVEEDNEAYEEGTADDAIGAEAAESLIKEKADDDTIRAETAIEPQQSMAELYSQLAGKMRPPPTSVSDTSTTPGPSTSSHEKSIPATILCPTCLSTLPNPCDTQTLRLHLSSLVHRLSLSDPQPGTSSKSASTLKKQGEAMEKLYIDSKNKGYILLQDMGWKQGIGLGLDEWEYLQERDQQKKKEKKKEVIVVSSSDEDDSNARDGEKDIFAPVPQSSSRSQSQPQLPAPAPAPSVTAQRKARLVPVVATYKNDKSGLGITPRPSKKGSSTKNRSTSSQSKRQRSEKQQNDREELNRIRQSLR